MNMHDSEIALSFRMARREIVSLFKTYDWSSTNLGSPLDWPHRLQQLVEMTFNSPIPSFIVCGSERILIYNGAFADFCGDKHPEAFGKPLAKAFPEVPRIARYYDRAFAGVPAIVRNLLWPECGRPEQETRLVDLALTPVDDGKLTIAWLQVQVVRIDLRSEYTDMPDPESTFEPGSRHKEVWSGLRESEERLRLALEVAQLAMWDWDIRTDNIVWSEEHFRMEGYEVGEVEPSFHAWSDRIHPEDLAATLAVFHAAHTSSEPYRHEFRLVHPDGKIVWSSALGRFFHDAQGDAVRMIGVMHDVTSRRNWEERQRVLVAELQHRTRNLIGVVQSLARKTLARSPSMDEFRDRFGNRLCALARVQGLLSDIEQGDRLTFDELLRAELVAHGAIDEFGMGERVTLVGPDDVAIHYSSVQTLALVLHELATNAAKYGALNSHGHLKVRWHVEQTEPMHSPVLYIEWLESGVTMPPTAETNPGSGYGRELIERALPYQLGAKTSFEMGEQGVRCTIELPLNGKIDESAEGDSPAVF